MRHVQFQRRDINARQFPTLWMIPPKELRLHGHIVKLDVVCYTIDPDILLSAVGYHC